MASVTTSQTLDSHQQPTPLLLAQLPLQLTFGSDSTPFSATPQQLPTRSYEVAEEIAVMNKKFEELVETVVLSHMVSL